jgi:creatinine amidohydrolase
MNPQAIDPQTVTPLPQDLLPAGTTRDERARAPVAVLPVGSYEQHGPHLPLITDTVVACVLAAEIAAAHPVRPLPPLTISCSHEHAAWPGTVSISAPTLAAVVRDVAGSLHASGVATLVLVNGHGGNYVLGNVVQEASLGPLPMVLFPTEPDWADARTAAGLATTNDEDMHAGELETSILLATRPHLVTPPLVDQPATDRRQLLRRGLAAYTPTGVVGRPSLASAEKGRALLAALVRSFAAHV